MKLDRLCLVSSSNLVRSENNSVALLAALKHSVITRNYKYKYKIINNKI
jgi:hypothetical protein